MNLQPLEGAVSLHPSLIDPNPNNARFSLRKQRIKELAEEIKVAGGIMEPIEVKPIEGGRYQVSFGDYRLAAANLLLDEGALDITVPAIIKDTPDGKDAILRNLMENLGRQDLTLMDQASAAQKMLDAGVDKLQVRTLLKRAGRKEPVSNSWLNSTLGFLTLPKKIQNDIHEGKYDWQAAADLVKVQASNPDKITEVVAKLEEQRKKDIERENKEEEKYLNAIAKAEEAEVEAKTSLEKALAKETERAQKLETAKANLQTAKSEGAAKVQDLDTQLKTASAAVVADPKAAAEVARLAKEITAAQAEAEKATLKAQKALDALIDKEKAEAAKNKEEAAEAKVKAAEAKKTAKAVAETKQAGGSAKKKEADKPVSSAAVKKAAVAAGVTTGGKKPLNRAEMMSVVKYLGKPGGTGKSELLIVKIANILINSFEGGFTENQVYSEILKAIGK